MRQALDQNSQITPEMRENIMKWMSGPNLGIIIMCLSVPVWAVFGMLGSLLGLAFFRKKVPPAPAAPLV
jgi:membrane-bound ClpP family serine protease